ncbi:hypothetical protein [Chroococcidiopsis sp. CCNUC1]|uniref:hypothetical protein n=1 Tax=Chroococcidiopsis sp. CCNUC1 TaxID=2653189 RepID=UPI00202039FA|nr:hypothetical protein [Chroococcidiopsis sp. CCNUC1]URD53455.1 hypothetical protein M5J74_30810 [Chroococcidiopsis sp. CCNUC1]
MIVSDIKGLEIVNEENEASVTGGMSIKHSYASSSADAYAEDPAGAAIYTFTDSIALNFANRHYASGRSRSITIGSNG